LGKGQIIIGNIGKVFADELAVGATQAAQGMIDFLLSSQGAVFVSNVIGHLAAGFEALKVILEPLVNTVLSELSDIWKTLTDSMDKIFGKTKKGTGAFNAFAFAGQLVNSVFKILSAIIQAGIKSIGNIIKAISESGKVIGTFFDFITMKNNTTWEDVENQIAKKDEAFKQIFVGIGEGFGDIVGTVVDEVSTFGDRVNEQAGKIEVKYKTTFENVQGNTRDAYDSLITGQEDFVSAVEEGTNTMKDLFNSASWNMQDSMNDFYNNKKQRDKEDDDEMEKKIELYQKWGETISGYIQPIFEEFGELIAKQELTWQSLWGVIKDTLSKLLLALGTEAVAQAAKAYAQLNFVTGALWTTAAALAFVGAGFIRGLRVGGPVERNEPVIVGEAGPELFMPDRSGTVFSNERSRNMLRGNTYNLSIYTDMNRTGLETTNIMLLHRLRSST
jgi:hypothetical protein